MTSDEADRALAILRDTLGQGDVDYATRRLDRALDDKGNPWTTTSTGKGSVVAVWTITLSTAKLGSTCVRTLDRVPTAAEVRGLVRALRADLKARNARTRAAERAERSNDRS